MSFHSDDEEVEKIRRLIDFIVGLAYFSKEDGCYVISLKCAECGKWYEEELDEAKSKLICGTALLCLACDNDSHVLTTVLFTQNIVRFMVW